MSVDGFLDFLLSLFIAGSAVIIFGFFPLIGIITGWYTRKRVIAIIVGAVPFPAIMIAGTFLNGLQGVQWTWFISAACYYAWLAGIGGLAGYLASSGSGKQLAVAFGLAVAWVVVLLSGIN